MNPTALITGASSGIGLELARLFAQDRYNLVLVARNGDALDALAADLRSVHGTSMYVIAKDLSEPAAASEVFEDVNKLGISIDVLVNNAGFAVFGKFQNTDPNAEQKMLQVNITTLTALTKLFLPGMIARKAGRILNVASTAAFQPGPLMAVYYASKAYVLHFSEALANELSGTGVTVTALCPGPTQTGFQARAAMQKSGLFKRIGQLDAESVAHAGYDGLMKGKTVVIPGMVNILVAFGMRFLPRAFATALARNVQREN